MATDASAANALPKPFRFPRMPWALLAIAVLLVFNFALTPGFFRIELKDGKLFGSLIDVLERGSPVVLLALGMTLVIATGGVDLSVGSVMAISGAVAAKLLAAEHGASVAIGAALGVSLLAGCINGLLVAAVGVQPIVATLILMVAGRGVSQLVTDGTPIAISNPAFEFLGTGYLLALPFAPWLAAMAWFVVHAVTRWTALGLFLEAVGGNARASHFSGIPVGAVKFGAYACSGLCAGVAGLLAAADIRMADPATAGLYLELDAILAVVIGGTALTGGRFSLFGAVLGALLMQGLTTTILARGVAVEFTLVVKALVIIAVSLLQTDLVRGRIGRWKAKPR